MPSAASAGKRIATVAENLSLPMANDPTRVTMVPVLDDASLAADKTVVAVVDFAALNGYRTTAPSTAHEDEDDEDDEEFDAATTVSTDNADANAGATFLSGAPTPAKSPSRVGSRGPSSRSRPPVEARPNAPSGLLAPSASGSCRCWWRRWWSSTPVPVEHLRTG